MSEELPFAESIECPALIQQIHGAPPHKSDGARRLLVGGDDDRPGRVALNLEALRDHFALARVQAMEELMAAQEFGDVLRRRVRRSIH